MTDTFVFSAPLWRWEGDAAWHFVTVPQDVSDDIEFRTTGQRGGFGSVRVEVTVGGTRWMTSLFPDRSREAYLLPVKKQVRDRESLELDDTVEVRLRLVLP